MKTGARTRERNEKEPEITLALRICGVEGSGMVSQKAAKTALRW